MELDKKAKKLSWTMFYTYSFFKSLVDFLTIIQRYLASDCAYRGPWERENFYCGMFFEFEEANKSFLQLDKPCRKTLH